MAFVRPSLISDTRPVLRGAGVALRPPLPTDYVAWAEFRAASRAELTPYEPRWSVDELSRSAFRLRLKRWQQDARHDAGYAFFLLDLTDGALAGGMTLTCVRRGVSQSAVVGYWIGTSRTDRGLATAGLQRLVRYAFDDLHLYRIEAACMPANVASLRVLEKVGFQREGLARRYLEIDGQREDHVLLALTAEETSA